jgi:hypothetical protein
MSSKNEVCRWTKGLQIPQQTNWKLKGKVDYLHYLFLSLLDVNSFGTFYSTNIVISAIVVIKLFCKAVVAVN